MSTRKKVDGAAEKYARAGAAGQCREVHKGEPSQTERWIRQSMPLAMRQRAIPAWAKGWKAQLAFILMAFNELRVDGRIASLETRKRRSEVLYAVFEKLRDTGYKIDNVLCLRTKHVQALLKHWTEKGMTPGTINHRLSILRLFCAWIGKPGMVPGVNDLGRLGFKPGIAKRQFAAERASGWEDSDKETILQAIEEYDLRFGLIFRLCDMFGLRRMEALMWCPHEHDWENEIAVTKRAKGGKERTIPFEEAAARALIDRCKKAVEPHDSMSGKQRYSLKQARNRFEYVARKFGITRHMKGVTAHDLRKGFAQRKVAAAGLPVPVLDLETPWPRTPEARQKVLEIMESMGHERPSTLPSYIGAIRVKNRRIKRQGRVSGELFDLEGASEPEITPE